MEVPFPLKLEPIETVCLPIPTIRGFGAIVSNVGSFFKFLGTISNT